LSGERRSDLGRLSRVIVIEWHNLEAKLIDEREIVLSSPDLEGAEIQFMDDERGYGDIVRLMSTCVPRDDAGRIIEQGDDGVGIEKIPAHRNALSKSGRFCGTGSSFAPAAASSSYGPEAASSSSQRQSAGMGSRMIAAPRLRMRTSSPSNLYSLGRRTACERPDQKIFAVSMGVA
jgi:hypothetical protein